MQLMIYAGLFCLNYDVQPNELQTAVLRIYQDTEVVQYEPTIDDIFNVVQKIIEADKIINMLNEDGLV